jgi:hypothetical protein
MLLLASCTHVPKPVNEITRIEFAQSGAWSNWPSAISIDNALAYKFYGGKGLDRHYYIGKVSRQFWDTLNRKIEKIDFSKMRPDDKQTIMDANYYELIIHWRDSSKRVVRQGFVITDSLSRIASWLDGSYRNIDLKQVSTPIKFETTFQIGPHINIDQVRFPPPIKN